MASEENSNCPAAATQKTDVSAVFSLRADLNAKSFVPRKTTTTSAAMPGTTLRHLPGGAMPPPLMGPGGYAIPTPSAQAFQDPFVGQAMLNPAMLHAGPPLGPLMPLWFPMYVPPPPTPVTGIGNVSLAALCSNVPPKFCCVLLVGAPGVGKTTIGRDLVSGLQEDNLSWQFFSGSNFVTDTPVQRAPWETTKHAFDALAQTLDSLIAKQATELTRGLIIDQNCEGVEYLHYLQALLKSRGLPLVGIVSLDVHDTNAVVSRIGGGEEQHERVIQARICEAANSLHLLRTIDASKSKDEVARSLRTMVLGLSAQQPTSSRASLQYSGMCTCPIVDNYLEYANVMNSLFSMVVAKGTQATFPGSTEYIPLSTEDIDRKADTFKTGYVVRRKVDGTKYLLVNDGKGLYLVPQHMRAVLRMPQEAWLGVSLRHFGKFVLDGDLVRLTADRSKEKFVAYDVLHWSEKNRTTSSVCHLSSWTERREKLSSHLCLDTNAFYPSRNCKVIVVYQVITTFAKALELIDPGDYPCEGLVFHPKRQFDETFLWCPPMHLHLGVRLLALCLGGEPFPLRPLALFLKEILSAIELSDLADSKRQFNATVANSIRETSHRTAEAGRGSTPAAVTTSHLNVNAKSFVPRKLDIAASAATTLHATSATPGTTDTFYTLLLAEGSIGLKAAQVVAGRLKDVPDLQTLDLSWTRIGDDGAQALAAGLKDVPQLRTLKLSWNSIGPIGVRAIAAALKDVPRLGVLALKGNDLGDDGAAVLGAGLKYVPLLQTLDLSHNSIGPLGAQALAAAMKDQPHLHTLNFSLKSFGGRKGRRALTAALQELPELRVLEV